jgi:GNAT superfamily N-acetyltransferase
MIRRLEPDQWELLRELRLEMLEREPQAYGGTYAREAPRDEGAWRRWAEGGTCFVAELDGEPAGLASWYADDEGRAILVSMYVRAKARGNGLGAALVDAVCAAAQTAGHDRIGLGVTEGSPARRLYERCGFVATGGTYPLRDDTDLVAESMSRALQPTESTISPRPGVRLGAWHRKA